MQKFIEKITTKLNLPESRNHKIEKFLETVSYYKLLPYVDFIKNNREIEEKINAKILGKDSWDAVTFLYRYNIKLSNAIYPYIYLLETTLKTKVNNLFCSTMGDEWYKDKAFLYQFNLRSINYIEKTIEDYLKESTHPSVIDFVENSTTLGFWNAVVESGNLWNSKPIKMCNLFSASGKINPATLSIKEINKKLRSLNDLRNCISHHNRIIGCKIDRKGYSNYRLYDVYQNILYLLTLLGCDDIDWMIGDLHCVKTEFCNGNSFESLYKEFDFINSCDIKSDKLIKVENMPTK